MGVLDRISELTADNTPDTGVLPRDTPSAFSKGLRGGMEDVAGQTHALLGQGGELVGANDFATEQRAKSLLNQQEAERLTADTPTWEKVRTLKDGWDYGTGLLGRSLPGLATGIAGATLMPGKGALAGIAGMTAATAPSTIGAQFEAQQNDPAQAKRDVMTRTLTGVGAGTAEAAAMSVVPQVVGGKLFGKAATGAVEKAAMPFSKAVMDNVPEAVLGNAAAGNVSARIGQAAASHLNPDRDMSHDTAEQNDAMISGAVMGAPFAVAGIAGSMRGKKAGGPASEPLPKGTDAEKANGVSIDAAPKSFADKVADLGTPLRSEPTTGEEHVQARGGIVEGDTPDTAAVKDAQGGAEAAAKAQRTMQKLAEDPTASRFQDELSKIDPTTSAGQMRVSDINAQHFEARQTAKSVADANAALDALRAEDTAGASFSKDASGADAGIYELMDSPEWNYLDDDTKQNAVTMTRRLIVAGEQGSELPATAMRATIDVLGKDTVSRLSKIYDAMGSKDPAKIESFYKALTKISEVQKHDDSLLTVVRNALPEHMIDTVRTPQIKEFVKQMQDLTGERMFKDMTPAEQAVKKGQINAKLTEVFGDKADAVNEAFAKHAQGEADLVGTTPPDRTDAAKANAWENTDENEFSYRREEANPLETAQGTETAYYGGGKKGDTYIEHRDVARAKYGNAETMYERLMRQAQEEHPTADVSWVSAKEHAKRTGILPEQLNEMTKGRPDEHGMIAVEKMADREAFGWKDIDAMRLSGKDKNGKKKSSHYESSSRIDTGTDAHPGPILDAMRVASHMMKKLPKSDVDEQGGMHQLARAFKEGIAAVSDHMSELLHVPDETVVARRGGKDITWGELQKVQNDTVKEDFTGSDSTTSEMRAKVSDFALRVEKSEKAIAALKSIAKKRELSESQQKSLEYHERQIKFYSEEVIPNLESAIEKRGDRAAFAEGKELGNDYGTGRDSGAGINLAKERSRVAQRDELRYGTLLDKLGGKKAGSPQEGAIWAKEAQQVAGALKRIETNVKSGTDKATSRVEYRKLLDYKKAIDAKDYTEVQRLRVEAASDAHTSEGEAGEIDAASRDAQPLGISEADPEGQIHLADAEHGDALGTITAKMKNARGEQTGSLTGGKSIVPKGSLNEGTVTPQGVRSLGNRISEFEANKSVAGRAIGTKARMLLDNFKLLAPEDQVQLVKIARFDKPSAVGGTIDGLMSKYRSKIEAGAARGAWADTVANEGGAQHAATLAQIARRSDPNGLQAMLDVLLADKKPNEFKRGLIDAANKRIAELVEKDPSEAYGLLIKGNEKPEAVEANYPALNKTAEKTLDYLNNPPKDYTTEKAKQAHEWAQRWLERAPQDQDAAEDFRYTLKAVKKAAEKALAGDAWLKEAEGGALSREATDKAKGSTPEQQKAAVDAVTRMVGENVEINAAADMLYAGAFHEKTDLHGPIINISRWALDPLSVGYHESLHWLADSLRQHGRPEVMAALTKAADSAYVRNFLREKFKDQPEALKQVEGSSEERVAYMFQFHANGMLKLGDRGKTILDKVGDLIRKVLGVWSNDRRAMHIMDYFASGEYAKGVGEGASDRGHIYKHMMEQGRNKTLDYLHASAKPLINLMDAVAGIGSARIQDMGIPALSKIADMVRLHGTKEGEDAGFLPAAGTAMRSISNKLVNRMSEKGAFTFEEANEAFANIALGTAPKNAKIDHLMVSIRGMLDEMHGYMKDAGVNVGDRGLGKNYLPRQWDSGYVAGHQAEFRAMIQKYVDSGEFKGTADQLMSRLMRDDGSELESADASARPGDQFTKKRDLHFITNEDAAPFMEKNAMRVLTSYIKQGTRRAEWSRRFEAMTVDEMKRYEVMSSAEKREFEATRQTPMEKMREAAIKQGAAPDQMAVVDKYLEGVTGQLGSDVQPETRKLFGQIMVYQNLRLLPMGFFSSLIDPVGVAVRGGSAKDVFNNFKRGIMEIPRGFKHNPKYDEGYHLAEDMGVIDNAVLQHVMGASYGLNAVGNKARAINETLFKWNLMEQMNTSQRVAATEASMGFLKKHGKGDFNEHSMRYLAELGLKPADIKLVDGRVAVRAEDFVKAGFKAEAAEAAHLKMRQAVNTWVDGAVLRPDQSQKAIWMNDAHYSLIAHMKQFAFSFQDTILKRVLNEARHGNYSPAVAMAGYIPVMLAADLTKGMIQGGGSQPAWKQDWDLGDYLSSAGQRAGLLGVAQYGVDAFTSLHHGGTGIGSLGGPTIGQLGDIVSTVGGSRGFAATAIGSMPANALWSGYLSNDITHSGGKAGSGTVEAPFEPIAE
ncbi:hypothetical protein [Herminiimonas sp. CN]|uniref:hypothetical protein n=1 Tax=Herminiimonas sp. CN TaxID=1349818 RepID=UPI00054FDE71|nr:hypothetical protein [Herminiimonas sp. CN]